MNQGIKFSVFIVLLGVIHYVYFNDDSLPPQMHKGYAAPGWEKVTEHFRYMIQLWCGPNKDGGFADDDIGLEWDKNTVSQYFSTSKGIGAVVMAMLVDRGLLDYTMPVSQYWPEFAQNGKGDITLETLLGHQAGLAVIDEQFDFRDIMNDDKKISKLLAAQKPSWKPGTAAGYHAMNIGLYEDQLVKRVDPKGRSIAKFFQEEVAKPYDLDLIIGLNKEENYRCARNVNSKLKTMSDYLKYLLMPILRMIWMGDTNSMTYKVFNNPKNLLDLTNSYNKPSWREVPVVSTNCYGTATALAKLYGILANCGKSNKRNQAFLSDAGIRLLQEPLENGNGTDVVVGITRAYGRGIEVLKSPTGSDVFGFPGAGGQTGKCDQYNKLGIGYITNHMTIDGDTDEKYLELEKLIYATINEL